MLNISRELRVINKLLRAWEIKKKHCEKIFKMDGRVLEEDITWHAPDGKRVIDYGLVFSHEPFSFKIPRILRHLWTSSQNECVKLINELIRYEQKKFKEGGISDEELGYVCSIKNIVHYVMKNRFKTSDIMTRKVVGGDLKDKSHFTVNKASEKDKKNEC